MAAEKIAALKHLFQVPISAQIKLDRFVYSFVVFGKNVIYLIDSGVSGSEEKIFEYIRSKGHSPENISALILTHSHPDHIGSAKEIKKKSGCRIFAHKAEQNWIEDVDTQFKDRPVPGFYSLVNGSVSIDSFLEDGQVIEIEDGLSIKVIHTPGHSAGSVSLYFMEQKMLMCADNLILPGDMPIYDDPVQMVGSLNKLREIDGLERLLPSWAEEISAGKIKEKIQESIEYLKYIHKQVIQASGGCRVEPMELCRKVIKNMDMGEFAVNPLVSRALQSHLKYPENPWRD